MKRNTFITLLASMALAVVVSTKAQILHNGVGYIPSQYRVDWSQAGLLPENRSGLLPETPAAADHLYVIAPSQDSDAQITSALQKVRATGGTWVIYFLGGVHRLSSSIVLRQASGDQNIIFRGAGAGATILEFDLGRDGVLFDIAGSEGSASSITANIQKGAQSFLCGGSFAYNDWIRINEEDRYVYQNEHGCVGQITQIDGTISGGYTIKDAASKTYETSLNLLVREVIPITNIGIENLTIRCTQHEKSTDDDQHDGSGISIKFVYAVNCWVKGVRSLNTPRHHITIDLSSHVEVSGSYLDGACYHGGGSYGYGVVMGYGSTNCLIENNIFERLRHSMGIGTGANCNVFTYNFSTDEFATWSGIPYQAADLCLHGRYSYANLYEENLIEWIEADATHDDHGPFNVFVRNKTYDYTESEWRNIKLVDAPYTSVLGCEVWDEGDEAIEIEGSSNPLAFNGYGAHNNVMRDHEYFRGNPGARSEATNNDVSYYYSSAPDFMQGMSFPSLGPRASGYPTPSQDIPAHVRFSSGPFTYLPDPFPLPASSNYQILTSGATLTKVYSDELWTFTASPLPGLSAGKYACDVWMLEGTISLPTDYCYFVGWPSTIGYSFASTNDASLFNVSLLSQDGSSMIVRTCFYKILHDELGGQINKWAPWDPTRTAAQAYLYCKRGETTSGALTENECWSGTHTLTGNVTVPDNITLTIADGATINLNGYYVQCQGSGQIIKQGSATFSPSDVSIQSGSVIKGQYPSVATAIANVVSGQMIIVASGTHTVGSNLTVASGVTLQVNAGATVNFTGSYKLQVSGVLTVVGSSGQHVIFDGQSHSRASMDNAMIVVQSGGTANIQYADFRNAAYELSCWQNSGAVTVQNCTFTNFGYTTDSKAVSVYYATGTIAINNSNFTGSGLNGMGVYATNTGTNVTVTENTFTSCRVGIRCYSSNASLFSNTIANSGYYGIQSDNVSTAAEYRDNTISNSSYGIYLNSSSPWIMYNTMTETRVLVNSGAPNFADFEEGEQLRGYNTIANAGAPLLRAQNYATPYLGYSFEGGYNSLYETDLPHMYVENHSGVYADNNYWGGGEAANYIDGTSWALARNPLASNPNPLAKASFTSYSPCADQSAITLEDEEKLFQQALDAGYGGEYEQARSILQALIENNSGSKFPPLAILMYYEFNRMELRDGNSGRTNETIEEELINFLASLENRDKADSLRPFGLKLSAREAGFSRDFKRMSDYHTLIIQDYPNSVHELTSLYDQIAYYVEIERDLENAKVLLARMIDAYPKESLTAFARILAGEDVELDELEKRDGAEPAEDQLPTQINLGPAVPNPFNPSTTISYQIPEAGRVTLRLYNMLGQLVATLVDREVVAGKHSVVWDGRNERGEFVAAGVYLYRMEVQGVVRTKKLVLAK